WSDQYLIPAVLIEETVRDRQRIGVVRAVRVAWVNLHTLRMGLGRDWLAVVSIGHDAAIDKDRVGRRCGRIVGDVGCKMMYKTVFDQAPIYRGPFPPHTDIC